MLRTLALVTSLALADSINPSTVIPGLYLATHNRRPRPLLSFTAGVFTMTFAGGLALLLGPGELALAALPHPDDTAKHLLELSFGGLALGAATFLWLRRDRPLQSGSKRLARRPGPLFALGAGIMAVELPTALPYFAAIAVIVGGVDPLPERVGLLAVFNVLFVLPLLVIAVARATAGARADHVLSRVDEWLRHRANLLMSVLVLAGSVALMAAGTLGLVAD